jgi:high-affinity iron transporter
VGPGQEIFEGVTLLISVAVMFYVSNWMISKAEADAWSSYIKGKVESSITGGSVFSLTFAAFLAVFREGAETILYY